MAVVAGLAATSAVLGFSSYWSCHDAEHPVFFQPLLWTVSLVKGSVSDFSLGKRVCPSPVPAALWVARLTALGAIFTGLAGVVIALFRSQVDRVRASLATSVTAVIGIDNETRSMISAIATTLNRRSTLVVVTSGPDEPGAQEARINGGRVVSVDFNATESLKSLSLWRNLERLYLMSSDPPTNQLRLDTITRALAEVGHRQRLPLTVRIDDPWAGRGVARRAARRIGHSMGGRRRRQIRSHRPVVARKYHREPNRSACTRLRCIRIDPRTVRGHDSPLEADNGMLDSALTSLAETLWSLRQLGYRSRPVWQPFIRVGTVTAEQLSTPWTWTSRSGHTMQAIAGDWQVRADGDAWSVRDAIFRTSYEPLNGAQWRRRGSVFARPAQPGETIETLEGPTTAADGDWVVRGVDGEEWPVPAQEFAERYIELDPAADATPKAKS